VPCFFFDTAALQHRYVEGPYSRTVRKIVSDRRWDTFIAEITVLEMASALARRCRKQNWPESRYDVLDMRFLRDIADHRLRVRRITRRDILRARHLIRFAGMLRRRNISSADALIATCCLALALERKERVAFYTSDKSLYSILQEIDAFRSALALRLL